MESSRLNPKGNKSSMQGATICHKLLLLKPPKELHTQKQVSDMILEQIFKVPIKGSQAIRKLLVIY